MLRWIVKLVASNSLQEKRDGDIQMLPYPGQWRSILLNDEGVLLWSNDDMKGCFFLFRLPPAWHKWFALNLVYFRGELGLDGDPFAPVYLACTVIPVGTLSAMGIVQYLHRRMCIVGTGSPQSGPNGLPGDREVRKDKRVPVSLPHLKGYEKLWQVYADDEDTIEIL